MISKQQQQFPYVTFGNNLEQAKLGTCGLLSNEIKSGELIHMKYSPSKGELNLSNLVQGNQDFEKYPFYHSPHCPFTSNKSTSDKNIRVAVVGTLIDCENYVLLTKRKKDLIAYPGAGHVEIEEELETSLEREISEEVGIELKDFKLQKQQKYLLYEAAEINEETQEPKFSCFVFLQNYFRTQHITIFFAIQFSESQKQIKIKMQEEEVEAYSWIKLESLFNFEDSKEVCQIHYLDGTIQDENIKFFHQIYDQENKQDGLASGHQIALKYYHDKIFKKDK